MFVWYIFNNVFFLPVIFMKTSLFFFSVFLFSFSLMAQLLELKVNVGHTGAVTSVAYSSDGKYLATGSDDQMVKLWDVFSGKELETVLNFLF